MQDEILSSIEGSLSVSQQIRHDSSNDTALGACSMDMTGSGTSTSDASRVNNRTYTLPAPRHSGGDSSGRSNVPSGSGEVSGNSRELGHSHIIITTEPVSLPMTTWTEIANRRLSQQQARLSNIRDMVISRAEISRPPQQPLHDSGEVPVATSSVPRPSSVELRTSEPRYNTRSRGPVPAQANVQSRPIEYRSRK